VAVPAASVGRAWVPKCTRGPEPTRVLLCRPKSATKSRPHPNLNDTGISLDGEAICTYDMYATIRLESQLNRKVVNSEGLSVAGEAQILASAVVDLLHYSHIPSFQYSVTRVSIIPFTGRAGREAEDVIMQNKPNFRMAQQRLTAGQEKGYVKGYELCVCENKANLAGRAGSVSARHRRGRPPCLPIPGGQPQGRVPKRDISRLGSRLPLRTGPRAKQSQFAGLKVDANAGMGKGL